MPALHGLRRALSSCASIALGSCLFFMACGSTASSGGGSPHPPDAVTSDTANPAALSVQINTDPNDSHLATYKNAQGTAWLFGTKDPVSGAPLHADKMVVSDGKMTVTELLDAYNRPTVMSDSTGRVARYTYTDTAVTIAFNGPDGSSDTQVIPFEKLPGFPQGPATGTQTGALAATDRPITVVTHVRLMNGDQFLKDVTDAQVSGTITNKSLTYTGAWDAGQNGYTFQFVHRTAPLDNGYDDCVKLFGKASTAFTYVGVPYAILGAFCFATPAAPICGAIVSWQFVAGGVIATVASAGTTYKANSCKDLLIPADPNIMTVSVTVQHPILGQGTGSASYDITNPSSSVQAGRLEVTVEYKGKASILSVGTVPSAPAAHQSYQFTFDYIPVSATIDWVLSGSDGYGQKGTTPVDTESLLIGTGVTDSIPGGAASVTDTVNAALMLSGIKLDEKTYHFTFH